MRHTWIVWITAAAFSGACASSSGHKSDERAGASVATATAELTELASSVEAGGIVRARVTALIASRVMAPIIDVRVRVGDRVHRGDVLVTLDARDIRADDGRARSRPRLSAAEVGSRRRSRRARSRIGGRARAATHDRMRRCMRSGRPRAGTGPGGRRASRAAEAQRRSAGASRRGERGTGCGEAAAAGAGSASP